MSWWRHHRAHHIFADKDGDPHTGRFRGFLWAHVLWIAYMNPQPVPVTEVPIRLRRPLVLFLERGTVTSLLPAAVIIALLTAVGAALEGRGIAFGPGRCAGYGFAVSTVLCYHAIFLVNSVCHGFFGTRRFETPDESRNVKALALLNFGEALHNNHHRFPSSPCNEHGKGEFDLTYRLLRLMSRAGWVQLAPRRRAATREE